MQIETSPDYTYVNQGLPTSVLSCCIMSAHYLLMKTDFFVEAVSGKWTFRQVSCLRSGWCIHVEPFCQSNL